MTYLLVFAPLGAFWALLTAQFRKPGANTVLSSIRAFQVALARVSRTIGVQILPAFRSMVEQTRLATESIERLGTSFHSVRHAIDIDLTPKR